MSEDNEPVVSPVWGDFIGLRRITPADAEITLGWRPSANESLLSAAPQTLEEQQAWIETRPESEINWMIVLKDTEQPVGMISLVGGNRVHEHVEVGRFLIGERKAAEGIPVAFEAMKLMYEVAFNRLGYKRVWGLAAEDNPAMTRFHKYLGWTIEGRLREHLMLDGRRQDAICLGILEREYRDVALPRLDVMIKQALMAQQTGTRESD